MRHLPAPLLFFLLAVSSAHAQAIWTGPTGGGMMAVQEAKTLGPDSFALGFVLDNYDRDPLGIDVFDARMDWRLGISKHWDLYGSYHISRQVSEPGAHPAPSPPLDIVVLNGASLPHNPYRAMYWPMPYLSHHPASLYKMVGGEYVFGIKTVLVNQRRIWPATSVNLQISIPGTEDRYYLSKGSGSGGIDLGFHTAATWKINRFNISTNTGITRTSRLTQSDRFIMAAHQDILEPEIQRPNILHGGLGVRAQLSKNLSFITEGYGWLPLGKHTPMLDESGTSDILAGLEYRVGHISFTAGLRQHLKPPPDGVQKSTGPLAGALDLSALPAYDQNNYLMSIDINPDLHRPGTSLIIVGGNLVAPIGARRIAETYSAHTTGNTGIIFTITLRN